MVMTVEDSIAAYLDERVRRHELGASTARNARSILGSFARTVAGRPARSITAEDVGAWLESLESLAPATRRSRFSALRMFCQWLVRRGHVRRDPTLDIRSPRQPRSVPRALPAASVTATLERAPDARGRLIVTLMVQQGLRCCEVERLQIGDLDQVNGHMRIEGKGGHERILPILAETEAALQDYLAEHPATAGPLVRSYRVPSRALRADTISGLVGGWMAAAPGVKRAQRDGVSAHALRHTTATDMLRGGAHLRDVQYALGHAHLSTTEVYLPFIVRGLNEAMSGRSYRRAARGRHPSAGGVVGALHGDVRTVDGHRGRPGERRAAAAGAGPGGADAGGAGGPGPPAAGHPRGVDRGPLGRAG
jgi:site-specific recombinase XerD